MERALAIDIGGTKLAAGLVDGDGRLGPHRRVPTPAHDGEAMFAALVELVHSIDDWEEAVVCGVGCGGPMTGQGAAVSPVNIPGWREFPLSARLADALAADAGLPVHVDNDAKALALAEGWLGAAVGCSDYLGMVVSTGVGGGLVVDGHLLDGAEGNAGHVGHVIVEPGGRRCGCGARGCLEAEASGTAIAAITGGPPAEAVDEVRGVRAGRLVGRAVASVANLVDLRLAVVAGSVALGYGSIFFDAAQDELDRRARLPFSRGAVVPPRGSR
ncbi:MAG: ROK family protein [Acidimicrobiia bacterium]|nr:ROK family protein [Acidimicrobiia bacterium]